MAKKGICMKLIQLNAWGGRIDKILKDFLIEESPDIFCGQEIISYPHGDSLLFFTAEEISQAAGTKYSTFGATASIPYMQGNAEFGNMISSKKPITKSEVVFTNLKFVKDFNFEDHDYNIRNFVHAVIEVKSKRLNILTHHGHHVRDHKDGTEDTDRQMKAIHDYIKELEGPVILTGDFNLQPKSSSLSDLNTLLVNLSSEYRLKTTRNSLTNKSEVCDYIFVSKDINVKNFYADKKIVSDHQALILEFDI
jgi:endonuclease/exonuclease/phosphatase family metal-dependent hydrolase